MVRGLILLLMLLASLSVQAKRIKIYPAEPMLGQAVTLSVPADIEFIEKRFNWAALEKCFAVAGAEYGSERVRFTLYPYRTGPCEIRREKWETWEVPSHFNVRPNPAVSIQWQGPKARLFAREAIVWQARVGLQQRSGFGVWLEQPGKGALRYQLSPEIDGWLFATGWTEQTGNQRLYSPFVAVKNPSGQIWRFPAPPQPVDIRPLPVYLPANTTVGVLRWQPVDLPPLVAADAIVPLRLMLSGRNLSADWLPDPSRQLPVVEGVRWLVGQREVAQRWDTEGLRTRLVLKQPVQFETWGPVSLSPLTVRYFDPDSGKLKEMVLQWPTVWVLPGWMLLAFKGMALLALTGLVLAAGFALWWAGWVVWLWRHRNDAPASLWAAMRRFEQATHPWRKTCRSQTPLQWLAAQPRPLRRRFAPVIERLNRALFGQ